MIDVKHSHAAAARAVAVVDVVQRLANGKADYPWAKEAALAAVDATG